MNYDNILQILKEKHGYDLNKISIFPGTRIDATDEEYADEIARVMKNVEDGDFEEMDDEEEYPHD